MNCWSTFNFKFWRNEFILNFLFRPLVVFIVLDIFGPALVVFIAFVDRLALVSGVAVFALVVEVFCLYFVVSPAFLRRCEQWVCCWPLQRGGAWW